jgi:ADP-ribosylglycohydrolase
VFYTYAPGTLSPYGHEAAGLVRSMAKHGKLLPEKYAEESAAEFKAYGGRLNSISKTYLTQWDAGARFPSCGVAGDTQAHCLVRVPALVARYAGKPELRTAVADAVLVHQTHPAPADYALAYAALLERIVLGAPLSDALKWAAFDKGNPLFDEQRKQAQDALADLDADPRDIVSKYGISCSLPGPFVGPLAIVFSAGGNFETAVRANIVAGGDSCSRAAVVGGLCGAAGGMAALPAAWRAKVTDWKELEDCADKIIAAANFA